MRRVVAAVAVLLTLGACALAIGAGKSSDDATKGDRVDAIFDTADFLIPGQDVKIAGAKVGKVKDVVLTPDNKARVQMQLSEPGFTPFHADADCTIQPQSLIGEKFIQCTPGTPREPAIKAKDDQAPTVPLSNTHAPVDLDLIFSTFEQPTNQRLALLVNELGSGLAGQGGELNGAIRRANPALQETRRVLDIVNDDRANLQQLITASHDVLNTLAQRRERIGDFLTSARKTTQTTADKRRQLGATVEGLPPLLQQARPSLDSVTTLARQGTPLLQDLREASPQLARVAGQVKPLADAARPALNRLASASVEGDKTLDALTPVVAKLRPFASLARTSGPLVDELMQSLKQRGVVEGLQDFVYQVALTLSRYDKVSHLVPPYLVGAGACTSYATSTVKQCDAHLAGGQTSARAKTRSAKDDEKTGKRSKRASTKDDTKSVPPRSSAPTPATTTSSTATPAPAATQPQATTPSTPTQTTPPADPGNGGGSDPVKALLDTLLGK